MLSTKLCIFSVISPIQYLYIKKVYASNSFSFSSFLYIFDLSYTFMFPNFPMIVTATISMTFMAGVTWELLENPEILSEGC